MTWPFIKYLCFCCLPKRKKSFDLALKRAIRRKLEITVPKSDQRIEDDPFLLLGYGMNSYFEIMVQLMIMVGLISLVTIPLMMTLSSFGALEQFPGYNFNQYTLGNIGGSDIFCSQSVFNTEATAMQIECPVGTTIDLTAVAANTNEAIFNAGIIPSTSKVNNYCQRSALGDDDVCSDYILRDKMMDDLTASCVGQKSC